jgi:hypothetical protein
MITVLENEPTLNQFETVAPKIYRQLSQRMIEVAMLLGT